MPKKVPAPTSDSVSLDTLKGFAALQVQDKDVLTENHRALLILRHKNKYEQGERLSKIRAILKPLKLFEVYLKTELKESRATANRAIVYYERIHALPVPVRTVVVKRAAALNPKRVEAFPPPETDDEQEINMWVDMQEKGTGRTIQVQGPLESPEILIRQNLRDIRRNLRKIPKKMRGEFITQLCGMTLTLGGMSAQRIEPLKVPDSFFQLGRPRLEPPPED